MKKILVILLIATFILFPSVSAFAKSFQGVSYTIIEKTRILSIKLSIAIRLDKKVSKDFLRKLAWKLKQGERRKYDRIFIVYYLPGMTLGSGAWATSHFDPNLEVKILGMTIDEEKALMNKSKKSSDKIIGKWLDDSPYGAMYTLLKRNGKIVMIRKFKDGGSSEKEMVLKKQQGKLRFEEKGGNDFGEYYSMEIDGRLGLYDNEGLINTIRSIKSN